MIKLIASDMDGTLLNNHVQVSDANAEAIKRAQEQGIHFVVATGRDYNGGMPFVAEKGIKCDFIGMNGAQLHTKDGENLYNRGLEKDTVRQLLEIFEEFDVFTELMTSEGIYSNNRERRLDSLTSFLKDLNPELSDSEARENAIQRVEDMDAHFVPDYHSIINDEHSLLLKMLVHSENGYDELQRLKKIIEDRFENIVVTSSSRRNIEINHIKAQKGIAVAEYAKKLNIKSDEVMTIGDNINDLSMIKWAKYGVAMENALPEVKKVASYSTHSNNENGVAEIITKVLNGKIYSE